MNIRKKLLTGVLCCSILTNFVAQENKTTPTVKSAYSYAELKKQFQNSLVNTDDFVKPLKPKGSATIDGKTVTLVPRKLNESPFVYQSNNNDSESAIRLYFEPENSQYNNLYLGALYSGLKIKKYPSNFAQWRILQESDAYLTGKVTSKTNNIVFTETLKKPIFFLPTNNYINGAQLPTQAIMTKINGSFTTNSNSTKKTVDVGGSYGPVSVDVSMGKSVSSNQSVIRVAAISKIYSLDVGEILGVQSKNKTALNPYVEELNPNKYPMYVSSIDYGFAIVAEINMSSLDQSTQASVKAQVEYGLASGSLGVDYQNAFSNSNLNVSYSYHGINPSSQLKSTGTITDIVNMMRREINSYMTKFASSNMPAVPLSCTFKYLYPKDIASVQNDVKINHLLLANQFYALENKPTFTGTLKPIITSAFMDGVPDGKFVSYGKAHVTLADNSKFANKSHSTWWFYIPSKRSQNVSENKYERKMYDVLEIKEPELDNEGNFRLYLKVVDENTTPQHTDIMFGQWRKSDNVLNINNLKKGTKHTVKFFNGDMSFDLQF